MASLTLPHFYTLSHKWHSFWENAVGHKMCVLIFSVTFDWNTSHSKKQLVRYCHKITDIFMQNTHYTFQLLIKLEFSQQIFEKYSTIHFHENLSSGSWVVPCGWADVMKLIVTFCSFVNMPKNSYCKLQNSIIIRHSYCSHACPYVRFWTFCYL